MGATTSVASWVNSTSTVGVASISNRGVGVNDSTGILPAALPDAKGSDVGYVVDSNVGLAIVGINTVGTGVRVGVVSYGSAKLISAICCGPVDTI